MTNNESFLDKYIILFKNYLFLRNRSERTIKEYEYDLNMFKRFLNRIESNINDINDIDDYIVEKFMIYLRKERKNQRGEPLSPTTINRKYFTLQSFFDFLIKKRYFMDENPMSYIDPLDTTILDTHIYLSVEQSKLLLDNVSTAYPERDKCMIELMLLLGLRVSEVARLNVVDIDLNNKKVYVHGKGDKERNLPLPPQIEESLIEYLKYRQDNFGDTQTKALFVSRNKRRISVRQIQMIVTRLINELGFNEGREDEPSRKKITCHKLRHTFGTTTVQNGTDILVLKDILGHSSINTTQIYAKASDKQIKEAIHGNPVYR